MSGIAIGSTWRENDNRFERVVEVISVTDDRVQIKTVSWRDLCSTGYTPNNLGRLSWVSRKAFGTRYRSVP